MSRICAVCGQPATTITVTKVPHTTITRIGLVFNEHEDVHSYWCHEHDPARTVRT